MCDMTAMKEESDNILERLIYLKEYMDTIDIDNVKQSLVHLMNEAEKDNQYALSHLSKLAELFSNLNKSFCKLADFIDDRNLKNNQP
jgi:hypothetical protein